MGAVSIFPDEEKKFKSQNWYDAKLRQGMGKLQSSGQKWSTVCVFFFFFYIESHWNTAIPKSIVLPVVPFEVLTGTT